MMQVSNTNEIHPCTNFNRSSCSNLFVYRYEPFVTVKDLLYSVRFKAYASLYYLFVHIFNFFYLRAKALVKIKYPLYL